MSQSGDGNIQIGVSCTGTLSERSWGSDLDLGGPDARPADVPDSGEKEPDTFQDVKEARDLEPFKDGDTYKSDGDLSGDGEVGCVPLPGDDGYPVDRDITCDGLDDDCDGQTDEDYSSPNLVECGIGACFRTIPETICVEGEVVENLCGEEKPGESDASCNGVDDDCDGQTDEDYLPAETERICGTGACEAPYKTACVAGREEEACTPKETTVQVDSVCDGEDNDCDGEVDEDYVSHETERTCDTGVCERNYRTVCINGDEQDECEPGLPTLERDTTCNGLDDDCDGLTDEDFNAVVHCGTGACQREVRSECIDGEELTTPCVPGEPLAEQDVTCDGVDNDCDGGIDEDFIPQISTQCGFGDCFAEGVMGCVGGRLIDTCRPGGPTSYDESNCDGHDNDCDGQTDEDYIVQEIICGVGACMTEGLVLCIEGVEQEICQPLEPPQGNEDTCNGIDDDCDGETDEGFAAGSPCVVGLGECRMEGVNVCSEDGQGTTCNVGPKAPGVEGCDNMGSDDDCDGVMDNLPGMGESCNNGLAGECFREGLMQCLGGELVCSAPIVNGSAETCTNMGRDDDCDGVMDNLPGMGESCNNGLAGECFAEGVTQCVEEALSCNATSLVGSEEICDGEDNDCDGETDEICLNLFEGGCLVFIGLDENGEALDEQTLRSILVSNHAAGDAVPIRVAHYPAGERVPAEGIRIGDYTEMACRQLGLEPCIGTPAPIGGADTLAWARRDFVGNEWVLQSGNQYLGTDIKTGFNGVVTAIINLEDCIYGYHSISPCQE